MANTHAHTHSQFKISYVNMGEFLALQDKRRSERAEQQRIRSEREKERQKRLEVESCFNCCNVH